jgi:hypothetical protein
MYMKRLGVFFIVILFLCGTVFAQGDPSAKFAAVYSSNPLAVGTYAESCDEAGAGDMDWGRATLLAKMKMPQGKEILAGVSAESFIALYTKLTGKNGGSASAVGYGKVAVKVKACNVDTFECFDPVPNGRIVMNARLQALSATMGGVINSCTDGLGGENPDGSDSNPPDGTIDIATECIVDPEEMALFTTSEAANHFNLVFEDLPQGTYEIKAKFKVLSASFADATAVELDGQAACAYAGSYVILGDRIVTLQDVRAVKDGGIVEFQ